MSDDHQLPDVTESTPDEERMSLLQLVTQDAAAILGLSLEDDSPDAIVGAVNECVREIKKGRGPDFPPDSEVDLLLGCLWASQLVSSLDWKWANIDLNDESGFKAVGIVSPSRDMVIYPFHFVADCLHNGVVSTILLSYNMLKERVAEPVFKPCSYKNVMNHVYHIVPPDA